MSDLKATLNDKMISRLGLSDDGQYVVRDSEMKGFFLVVGKRKKTFTVQGEFRKEGVRHWKKIALGTSDDLTTRDARVAAKAQLAKIAKGDYALEPKPELQAEAKPAAEITLRQAWARYRVAHLERKNRSESTIASYADHVERLLADWLDKPLRELGEEPSLVAARHDALTISSGPYGANGCMRTLRAVYNHARKSVRGLPPENPVMAVDWNEELRRDCAMGSNDIAEWMTQAGRLRNAIRREFHLFTLLSGCRPTALKTAKVTDLNFAARILRITKPKGGAKRAFDIPLSRQMICCLIRAMRIGRMLHPEAAQTYVFTSEGLEGHLVEHKEDRATDLSKWGNDLRHTYRTLGQAAGLSEVDMHLLMNHSLNGANVNEGYITRSKLLNDHLRSAQQRLSDHIIAAGTAPAKDGSPRDRIWPLLPSRRVGDEVRDPTLPDRRVGVGWSSHRRQAAAVTRASAKAA
jgi:integrase